MTDYTLLHDCIEQSTEELFGYVERFVTQLGYTVVVERDRNDTLYMVCLPDAPTTKIALVAHVDTIIRKDGVDLYYEGGIMRNALGVLGADDRAGVYGLLHTVAFTNHRPLLFFTNFEETGGRGVKALCDDRRLHDWLIEHDIRLFIELDRANATEYVYYSWELPKEIHAFAQDYGFKEAVGSYSDVADLTAETTIPHLNLSIGYRNQHGKAELLSVPDMMRTIAALDLMLYRDMPQVYIQPEPPRKYESFRWSDRNWATYYDQDWSKYDAKAALPATTVIDDDDDFDVIVAACKSAGADVEMVQHLMDSGWTLAEAIEEDLIAGKQPVSSLDFATRGSCFICMSKHMLHDELLVCQECYHRSMERR